MPEETEIENKGVKIGLKTLLIIIGFVISATWGVSAFINSFKASDAAGDKVLQDQIDAINRRLTIDSVRRDFKLRHFSNYYDTSQIIH